MSVETVVRSADDMIAVYGSPHEWDRSIWWLNGWRLICEMMGIRVLLDIALRCPDPKLVEKAREKLGRTDDLERLDLEWPGRDAFQYNWGMENHETSSQHQSNPS